MVKPVPMQPVTVTQQKTLDEGFLELLARDLQSLSICEDNGMQAAVSIWTGKISYKPPSRNTLKILLKERAKQSITLVNTTLIVVN